MLGPDVFPGSAGILPASALLGRTYGGGLALSGAVVKTELIERYLRFNVSNEANYGV
jgi:hypothetical protein